MSTDERGALVTVDGRAVGFTPTVIQGVPAGARKVRVTLRGYAPVERDVERRQAEPADASSRTSSSRPLREVTAVSRYAESVDDAPSSVSDHRRAGAARLRLPDDRRVAQGMRGVYHLQRSRLRLGRHPRHRPAQRLRQPLARALGRAVAQRQPAQQLVHRLATARVDLHDVERIEVVRGPGSLLYGTGAFSGVVNLVTRPRDEPNSVHVGVGTYDDAVLHGARRLPLQPPPERGRLGERLGGALRRARPRRHARGTPRQRRPVADRARGRRLQQRRHGGARVVGRAHGAVVLPPARARCVPVGAYGTHASTTRARASPTRG